jgi:amino acid permease
MIIHFMFMCLVTTPFDETVLLSSASSDKLCMVRADSAGLFLPAAVAAFCHCYTI